MQSNNSQIGGQIGGAHYQKDIQPWDAMEAWMSKEAFQGFLQGNAIKYLARWKEKGGVEDLQKAQHYIQKLIETEAEEKAQDTTPADKYQETQDYYHYVGV